MQRSSGTKVMFCPCGAGGDLTVALGDVPLSRRSPIPGGGGHVENKVHTGGLGGELRRSYRPSLSAPLRPALMKLTCLFFTRRFKTDSPAQVDHAFIPFVRWTLSCQCVYVSPEVIRAVTHTQPLSINRRVYSDTHTPACTGIPLYIHVMKDTDLGVGAVLFIGEGV